MKKTTCSFIKFNDALLFKGRPVYIIWSLIPAAAIVQYFAKNIFRYFYRALAKNFSSKKSSTYRRACVKVKLILTATRFETWNHCITKAIIDRDWSFPTNLIVIISFLSASLVVTVASRGALFWLSVRERKLQSFVQWLLTKYYSDSELSVPHFFYPVLSWENCIKLSPTSTLSIFCNLLPAKLKLWMRGTNKVLDAVVNKNWKS